VAGPNAPVRVTLACSGLDHVVRGYETIARDLFRALHDSSVVDLDLVKGSGPTDGSERSLGCVRRDGAVLPRLARLVRRPSAAYEIEAVSFAAPLLRHLRRHRPNVLITSDKPTAIALHGARRITGGDFRILFSNGGPYDGPFPYADFVQHLTEGAHTTAEGLGEPRERSVVVPYGFDLPALVDRASAAALRPELGLPTDRVVVIAVGALDLHHKRHDHLAAAIARLPAPRPFLLLLGQPTPETDVLHARLRAALGSDGYAARTVAPGDVPRHLAAADVFALASLVEGFGRAYVEAAAAGLPCVVHDFPVAREVLGPWGRFTDMADVDAVADAMADAVADAVSAVARQPRVDQAAWIAERYGWPSLRPRYEAMLARAATISLR
jgi:glycosyltransferase involved in cell wall biosynthesis